MRIRKLPKINISRTDDVIFESFMALCHVPDDVCDRLTAKLKDINASDFLLSIFSAALHSYRHVSLLHPFPTSHQHHYLDYLLHNGEKDIHSLRDVFASIPPIHELVPSLLSPHSAYLMDWLLCSHRSFTVHSLCTSSVVQLYKDINIINSDNIPEHVVELVYDGSIPSVIEYDRLKCLHGGTRMGFHGSSTDAFHSIVRNGLMNHLNKTAMYGAGTYLSSHLDVSMAFTKSSRTWNRSVLGNRLTCVAVCEYIYDHPDVVVSSSETVTEVNRRSTDPESTYIVIRNDVLVRVRYVLIFSRNSTSKSITYSTTYKNKNAVNLPSSSTQQDTRTITNDARPPYISRQRILTHCSRHIFVWVVVSYLVFLLALGLSGTTAAQNLIRFFSTAFGMNTPPPTMGRKISRPF